MKSETSKIREQVEKLSNSKDGDQASLAKAVLILNESLQQHSAKIQKLEKEIESLKKKISLR